MYRNLKKIADLQAYIATRQSLATHCELEDRLFSNARNVYAEVVNICFVIIIKIYEETSNQSFHMNVVE